MVYAVIILSIVCLILLYIVFNLTRKNEYQEDIVVSYMRYLDNISRVIELADEKLKNLDEKGSFSSDDEIGFMFKQIQVIQGILNEFIIKESKDNG